MIWEKIRGQEEQIDFLRRSAGAGRLSHAFLFVGPPGVGKRRVARALATSLFCERFTEKELEACGQCRSCLMMLAGTHPDFLSVSCPEGKSELPIELLVGSRENRGREGLCHDLSLRPMAATRRVAVIDDAERMSTESANALLKTLEEPPSYAVIVLLAGDAAKILPTIRSRCQILRFAPLSQADVATLVRELDWAENETEAEAAAALSGGSLTVAQQVLNPELRRIRAALFEGLSKPLLKPATLAQNVVGSLEAIGGDTQTQRQSAQWVVRFIVDYFQSALREWSRVGNGPAETAETIGEAIDRAIEAEEQLAGNVSVPLCLECLFSDLATILESVPQR